MGSSCAAAALQDNDQGGQALGEEEGGPAARSSLCNDVMSPCIRLVDHHWPGREEGGPAARVSLCNDVMVLCASVLCASLIDVDVGDP